MAAIDKIYVKTWEEYSQFRDWCKAQPKLKDKYGKEESITAYLYKHCRENWNTDCEKPIFMAPYYVDAYVIRNCPLDFIQKELMVNYGHWSQERIKDFYNDVINLSSDGEYPYWAKKEDFIFNEDGTVELKGLEESDYSKILKGELYATPYTSKKYVIGKHFKCTKHPKYKFNKPFKCGSWFIDIETPDNMEIGWMWYHPNTNTWDFYDEYVISKWSSSTTYVKTIKALMRHMRKWNLPVGTKVKATGRYRFDDYEFIIKK